MTPLAALRDDAPRTDSAARMRFRRKLAPLPPANYARRRR